MKIIVLLSFGLLAFGASAVHADPIEPKQDFDWWKNGVIYQIYPRSFKDDSGDGIGDLNGIISKLEHIKDAGANTLWLSPIYASPQKDYGYDISNYTDINPEYGTLEDFDRLLAKAKSLGLKVILDFVPNHTSDQHEWFKKSEDRIKPYDDYYIWVDAKKGPNGERLRPNNWMSPFGGDAWDWSEKRQQYYYHAFLATQPDLNYRNPNVRKEMEDVLTYWMDRGVDGFRIDVIYRLFEDPQLRDEPVIGGSKLTTNYDDLDHIYTTNLDECYTVAKSWSSLVDNYVKDHRTDSKFMIAESYGNNSKLMGYYNVGINPFNFMFIKKLNNTSPASEFKIRILEWLESMPKNAVSNWVVGNHDRHRVATRYGSRRADQIIFLAVVLPGITVVYNGDEIGMVDRPFTYKETQDPNGCQYGPDEYQLHSRDPERTPYQWDDTTNAGFSTAAKTWLPINSNYKTLNLAAQKKADISVYKTFQALTQLKNTSPTLKSGNFEVVLVSEKVLGVVRRLQENPTIVLLINFDDDPVTVDVRTGLNIVENLTIQIPSTASGLTVGSVVNPTNFILPGAASVILY